MPIRHTKKLGPASVKFEGGITVTAGLKAKFDSDSRFFIPKLSMSSSVTLDVLMTLTVKQGKAQRTFSVDVVKRKKKSFMIFLGWIPVKGQIGFGVKLDVTIGSSEVEYLKYVHRIHLEERFDATASTDGRGENSKSYPGGSKLPLGSVVSFRAGICNARISQSSTFKPYVDITFAPPLVKKSVLSVSAELFSGIGYSLVLSFCDERCKTTGKIGRDYLHFAATLGLLNVGITFNIKVPFLKGYKKTFKAPVSGAQFSLSSCGLEGKSDGICDKNCKSTPTPTPPASTLSPTGTKKPISSHPTIQPTEEPTEEPTRDPGEVECENGQTYNAKTGGCDPDENSCRKDTTCYDGRRNANCDQPHISQCTGCGNGIPISDESCSSRCQCNPGWTGVCCNDQAPGRSGGDPHLETLDGVKYDFFGIGEFWGCKSVANDFGFQYRFFGYEKTSFIGGVAIKAGNSSISVMTEDKAEFWEQPRIRIDGKLVSVNSKTRKYLHGETVLVDIQKPDNGSDVVAVLLSIKFKSGVSFTVEVVHSNRMKRHFLNTILVPSMEFRGTTEGLCGFMDGEKRNDLKAPTGEVVENVDTFSELWRITSEVNDGSWSWNSSNFHPDDPMTESYTRANHTPVYGTGHIDPWALKLAHAACSSQLSTELFEDCVMDVAVTQDKEMAVQGVYKPGCPNACSGRGVCNNDTCVCMEGWSGESCQQGSCDNTCANGDCIQGFCKCHVGWEGNNCNEEATCYNVNNCTSPRHGVCKTTDVCLCHVSFIGSNCSIKAQCINVGDCSGHGVCVDMDVCKCDPEYAGTNCSKLSCRKLDYCSGHGQCINNTCVCSQGWKGRSCAIPDCSGVNYCSGHGYCIAPDTCKCDQPWYVGVNCSEPVDCEAMNNCSGNGVCVKKRILGLDQVVCKCFEGFGGPLCNQSTCPDLNDCSPNGTCVEPNLCQCDPGFSGRDCSNFSCEGLRFCSGHGQCVQYEACQCDQGWSGAACDLADCSHVKDCSTHGLCIKPNVCDCYPGFEGKTCETKSAKNLFPPEFLRSDYNTSVAENIPVGTSVLKVMANDSDPGRNGEVVYSLSRDSDDSFSIGAFDGVIYSSVPLDYEVLANSSFNLTVIARDRGVPELSSSVNVIINILDQNDNCPEFTKLPDSIIQVPLHAQPPYHITTVEASDKDSGINGLIEYSIVGNTTVFAIDKASGRLEALKTLKQGMYKVLVKASEPGSPTCGTEAWIRVETREIAANYTHTTVKPTTVRLTTAEPTTINSTVETTTVETTTVKPTTVELTTAESTTMNSTDYVAKQSRNQYVLPVIIGFSMATILLSWV